MKNEKTDLVEKLELALASLIHDNKDEKLAIALGAVVEWLHKNEFVIAVLEAEALGLDDKIVNHMRRVFDVRW
jgi:hypothetical protein